VSGGNDVGSVCVNQNVVIEANLHFFQGWASAHTGAHDCVPRCLLQWSDGIKYQAHS